MYSAPKIIELRDYALQYWDQEEIKIFLKVRFEFDALPSHTL